MDGWRTHRRFDRIAILFVYFASWQSRLPRMRAQFFGPRSQQNVNPAGALIQQDEHSADLRRQVWGSNNRE